MHVEILQENLQQGLTLALRFVSKKASLPILNNLLLEAKENQIHIHASNLETAVSFPLPAKVIESGKIAVSAKLIGEYVKLLPAGKLTLTSDNKSLTINRPGYKATFACVDPEDFPTTPEIDYFPEMIIDTQIINQVVDQIVFSASKEEARPVLASILFKFNQQEIEVVSTDGYRLSRLLIQNSLTQESFEVLIPSKVFQEIGRLATEFGLPKITLRVDKELKSIQLITAECSLITRLVEGEYPQYQKILPKKSQITFQVDKSEFLDLLRAANVFASQSSYLVKLRLAESKITISANASTLGDQTNEMTVTTDFQESIEVAFNIQYLLDVLNHSHGKTITVGLNQPLQPVMVKDETDEYLHVIMPVRTQS